AAIRNKLAGAFEHMAKFPFFVLYPPGARRCAPLAGKDFIVAGVIQRRNGARRAFDQPVRLDRLLLTRPAACDRNDLGHCGGASSGFGFVSNPAQRPNISSARRRLRSSEAMVLAKSPALSPRHAARAWPMMTPSPCARAWPVMPSASR